MPGNLTPAGKQQILNLFKPGFQSSPQNIFSWSRVRLVYEDDTATGAVLANWETTLHDGNGGSRYATNAARVEFSGLDVGKRLKALQLVDDAPVSSVVAEYVFAQPITHSGSLVFEAGTLEIGFGRDVSDEVRTDTQTRTSVDGYAGVRLSPVQIGDHYTDQGADEIGIELDIEVGGSPQHPLVAANEGAWTVDSTNGKLTAQLSWTNGYGQPASVFGGYLYRKQNGASEITRVHSWSLAYPFTVGAGATLQLNLTVLVS
jgi:hypothetical protein